MRISIRAMIKLIVVGTPAFGTLASTCSYAIAQSGQPILQGATDQPVWRAEHGPLLTVSRVGNRLVAGGDRGAILLSDDQGAHWREVASGTDELLTAAVFTSATEGWMVGQDATILHTKDAGEHWTLQNTNVGADQALFSVASLGMGHLIATGSYALVLETEDGGGKWTHDKLPNLDEDYHLNCVQPRGADIVITGEAGHAFVRHGTTWTPMPVPYDGSQFGCLSTRNGDIYSFGLRGSLFVSTATVPVWKRIDTGEQRPIFGGAVLANGDLALVGGNGLVMMYNPHSSHPDASAEATRLRTLPPPTGGTLSAVTETQSGKWVIVGEDGIHLVDPTAVAANADGEMTQ